VFAEIDVQPAPDVAQMRPETGMEHIARDMREGRFPERSEVQMVPVAPPPHDAMAERVAALVKAAKGIMAHMPDHPDTAWQDLTEALDAMMEARK
jgi:hypothetical protein